MPKERSRPYDTSEPATLADSLSQLFALRGYGRPRGQEQLRSAWEAVAGPQLSRSTKVLGLRNGILQIGVSHSAPLNELASFQRADLLARLREGHSQLKIRDLKFRLRGNIR